MKSNKQTKVLLMHENIDSAYMYGTSNEKKNHFHKCIEFSTLKSNYVS